jgi:RecA/RadA recombinase
MAFDGKPKKEKPVGPQMKMVDMDEGNAAARILSAIRASFSGPPGVVNTDVQDMPTYKYQTGILSLDYALGVGGLLGGRILDIWGEQGTGKTLLSMTIAGAVQRSGGIVGFCDSEGCVTGDTLITDANTGDTYKIEDIVLNKVNVDTVPCYDVDGDIAPKIGTISHKVYTGIKDCMQLATERGATLKATLNHKVVVAGKGWVRLDEVAVGDYVARPKMFDNNAVTSKYKPELYKLVGYLLGDGCLTSTNTPRMSIHNIDVLDDVCDLVSKLYPNITVQPVGNTRGTWSFSSSDRTCNELVRDIKELGIIKINSDKIIPECFMNSSTEHTRHLLAGLIMSDGSVHASRNQMTFDSSSKTLANQVKYLLHKIGVCSKVLVRPDDRKSTYKTMYRVLIQGVENMAAMVHVPLVGYKKTRILKTSLRGTLHSTFTSVPRHILTEQIIPKLNKLNVGVSQLRTIGVHSNSSNTVRDHVLFDIKEQHGVDYTKWSTTNVWWDKVISNVPIGKHKVYDLTVPEWHNFIANDIVVHNTFSPAFGKACGLDTVKNFIYVRSTPEKIMTGEDFFEIIRHMTAQGVHYIMVDSVPALVPAAKFNTNFGEGQQATHARLMSEELMKLNGYLTGAPRTLVTFINQIRGKPNVMFGPPEEQTGGNALKFYRSYGFEIRKNKDIIKKVLRPDGNVVEKTVGVSVRLAIKKNKTASKSVDEVGFDMYTEFAVLEDGTKISPGVDIYRDITEIGIKSSVIEKTSSWYKYDKLKCNGSVEFAEALRENPAITQKLRAEVLSRAEVDSAAIESAIKSTIEEESNVTKLKPAANESK